MKKYIGLSLFLVTVNATIPCWSVTSVVRRAESLASDQDDLKLRALIRSYRPERLGRTEWWRIRETLHRRPGVGHDLLIYWDRIAPASWQSTQGRQIAAMVQRAETYTANKEFAKAANAYKAALGLMNANEIVLGHPNFFLYQTILHQLGRALYANKEYADAIKVYQWVSVLYPQYRQVQFEKMWSGSMAQRFEIALGAITSQRSSYFSKYLEPETYLVQFYLYNRLCRNEELQNIRNEVDDFAHAVEDGTYNYAQWAHREIETTVLLGLQKTVDLKSSDSGLRKQLSAEIEWIKNHLEKRFAKDLPRLKEQLRRVRAFLTITKSPNEKVLPQIVEIPGLKQLLVADREMWPVQDAEDWLDEIGQHVFIGKSECAEQAK